MTVLSEHFLNMEKWGDFPESSLEEINNAAKLIDENPDVSKLFSKLVKKYMSAHPRHLGSIYLPQLKAVEKSTELHEYTVNFLYIMACSEILHERYKEKGIDEEIFRGIAKDFRCKLIECIECERVTGTFVADWNDGFFSMNRFPLGRFQFEYSDFDRNYITEGGIKIKRGQKCLNMHIPSLGTSITDDIRLDSYKRAYDFFPGVRMKNGLLPVQCSSWLLFPAHRQMLPETSNIIKFMNDFEIYESKTRDNFNDDWRIWGHYSDLPLEDRPADTSLRKGYKDWMMAGNKTGYGRGILFFDGEKIVK